MAVFLFTVLFVYLGCCVYAFLRGYRGLPKKNRFAIYYAVIFCLVTLTYPVARVLENYVQEPWVWKVLWIGAVGMGFGFYVLLGLIIIDLLRLFCKILGRWIFLFEEIAPKIRIFGTPTVWVIALCLTIHGTLNALQPVVRQVRVQLFKPFPDRTELRVAMVSDIHMGSLLQSDRVEKMVDQINDLKPDIILLVGDIIDEDAAMVVSKDWGRSLRFLQAPLGVYAVTGNHEYYAHVDPCVAYLTHHYVRVLRDETIKIADSFYLCGREDFARTLMTGEKRTGIADLIGEAKKDKPIIVMDHQPRDWKKAAETGVDLYLSGHTHAGQLWPLHWVTRAIFGVKQGYQSTDQTSIYVTNGFGTWGPPMRVGNRPEIVLLTLVGG